MTDSEETPATGAVSGGPRRLLRLEGLVLGLSAAALYGHIDGSWGLFLLLFLVPDLSFAAFLIGPRAGAVAYNTLHATVLPIALAVVGVALHTPLAVQIALIWLAHIGFDRALGYGLKYSAGFAFTHLGRIGKDAAD